MAIKAGVVAASYALGDYYLTQKDERSQKLAAFYLQQAARAGHGGACFALGVHYFNAPNTLANRLEAAKFFVLTVRLDGKDRPAAEKLLNHLAQTFKADELTQIRQAADQFQNKNAVPATSETASDRLNPVGR